MGIAVISPNVRGLSGYGKSYLKLDNDYKREESVRDIGKLLDYEFKNIPESGIISFYKYLIKN